MQTLRPILALPETDHFRIVRNWRNNGIYDIAPKECALQSSTMIPLEAQQSSCDIETVIKAMMLAERKYLEWSEQIERSRRVG